MIHVVVGIIKNNNNEILIAQRPEGKHLAGYWEFPGGKVELNEKPIVALKRELFEELDIKLVTANPFKQISYQYPEKKVLLDFYQVNQFIGLAQGKEGQAIKWVKLNDLANYCFPEVNYRIVDELLK